MPYVDQEPAHLHDSRLRAKLKSGKVHGQKQPDGSWLYLPRHHGFCPSCGAAFGTDRAFDAHRSSPSGGHCLELKPPEFRVDLNQFGTPVWRLADGGLT